MAQVYPRPELAGVCGFSYLAARELQRFRVCDLLLVLGDSPVAQPQCSGCGREVYGALGSNPSVAFVDGVVIDLTNDVGCGALKVSR